MTEIWLIRHGDCKRDAAGELQLTPKGWAEAHELTSHLILPPDLIVTSNTPRAKQTARPTIDLYPDIPRETWPIHTWRKDRMQGGALSDIHAASMEFDDMSARARKMALMAQDATPGLIFAFTHDKFMHMCRLEACMPQLTVPEKMSCFDAVAEQLPIPLCSIMHFTADEKGFRLHPEESAAFHQGFARLKAGGRVRDFSYIS
jgi:hypothetical protein